MQVEIHEGKGPNFPVQQDHPSYVSSTSTVDPKVSTGFLLLRKFVQGRSYTAILRLVPGVSVKIMCVPEFQGDPWELQSHME